MRARWIAVLVPLACTGPPATSDVTTTGERPTSTPATLPLEALDDPEVTTVARDLAPSQVTASTVSAPAIPPPCTPDQLQWWAASAVPGPDRTTVDALIRVRNTSDGWCEVDIGRSPLLDPAVEPDVWLLPGGEADLRVGHQGTDCVEPELVSTVQVGVGDASVLVPALMLSCGWWLDAFVPLEPPSAACAPGDLALAVAELALVARVLGEACQVGRVSPARAGSGSPPRPAGAPEVRVLHPGDVVAIGTVDVGADCEDAPGTVELDVDGGGTVAIDGAPCGATVWAGAPAPWFGTEIGPSATSDGAGHAAGLLEAIDPFD